MMSVVLNAEGEVLLEKRPPTGVWGGLWSLPEYPDRAALECWRQEFLATAHAPEAMAPLKHTFSHFQLQIQPYRIRVNGEHQSVADEGCARWHSLAKLGQLGLPAPVRHILELVA